jgi:hypothetical protein
MAAIWGGGTTSSSDGADHAPEMTMMPASSGDLASTDGTALSPAASMAELKTAARMIRAAAVKRSGL